MIAYFSAVIINFGDFARFSKSEKSMRRGNFYGLPVSLAFFTFLSLFTTAGAYIVLQGGEGEPLTNPARSSGWSATCSSRSSRRSRSSSPRSASTWCELHPARLRPVEPRAAADQLQDGRLSHGRTRLHRRRTLGRDDQPDRPADVRRHPGRDPRAALRCLVADYYIVQRRSIKVADLFSMDEAGRYFYQRGWNMRALIAIGIAAIFSSPRCGYRPSPAQRVRLGDRRPHRRGSLHRGDVEYRPPVILERTPRPQWSRPEPE